MQFDKVVVMCRGYIIYNGPPNLIEYHFRSIGFKAPEHTNPADHLMSILSDESIKIEALQKGVDIGKAEV